MADALPSTGNIGERRKEGDTTFEWDGVAWFRVKENQDNTFADDVDYTLSVSGDPNPTITLTSSEGATSNVNVRGIGDATVGSDQFGIFINATSDQAAIIDTNGTPSLAGGITAEEIRNLIGAGSDEAAILDNNGTPELATGITADEIRVLIGAGQDTPAWSATATYTTGDVVFYNFGTGDDPKYILYRAQENVGPSATTPPNDSSNWAAFGGDVRLHTLAATTVRVEAGDIVRSGNQVWIMTAGALVSTTTLPAAANSIELTLDANATVNERMSLLAGVGTWSYRGQGTTGSTSWTQRSIGAETTVYYVIVANGLLTAYTDQALTNTYGTFRYSNTS